MNCPYSSFMKSILVITLTGLVVLHLSLCTFSAPSTEEEKKVDIHGKITKINPASEEARTYGTFGILFVEGIKPDGKEDKAFVTVTEETLISKQVGQARQTVGFEDLKEGLQVEIKFKGPVFMSYPVQARAGEILILEQGGE